MRKIISSGGGEGAEGGRGGPRGAEGGRGGPGGGGLTHDLSVISLLIKARKQF